MSSVSLQSLYESLPPLFLDHTRVVKSSIKRVRFEEKPDAEIKAVKAHFNRPPVSPTK